MRSGPDEDTFVPKQDGAEAELAWRRVTLEDEILSVLEESRLPGEQFIVAFRRKEHQIGELFALLNASDSLELQRRLRLRLPTDLLAARFAQLTVERQARLITFLMSTRRRFALVSYDADDI